MKLDQLTHEHLMKIAETYEKYCGGSLVSFMQRDTVEEVQKLVRGGNLSWRVGSKWDANSKFTLSLEGGELTVGFMPNLASTRKSKERRQALEAGEKFREEVLKVVFGEDN